MAGHAALSVFSDFVEGPPRLLFFFFDGGLSRGEPRNGHAEG